MTTVRKTRTTPALDPVETFRQQVTLKLTAAAINKRSEALKKRLKDAFRNLPGVYANEKGSLFYDLPETIEVEGLKFKGMEMRRSVPVTFNEETAEKVLKKKSAKDKSIIEDAQSSYIDQDKIYRLLAEERLTQAEVDSMFEEGESFSFYAVEGEVL